MTTNGIRLRIISSVLRMPREKLPAVLDLCRQQLRLDLPADLDEWVILDQAAHLLHMHPGSIRRLAMRSYPLLVERRRTPRGQRGIYLNRSAIAAIAARSTRAGERRECAAQATFRARLGANAHLSPARKASAKSEESPGQSERLPLP